MDRRLTYSINKQFEGFTVGNYLKAINYSSQLISNQKHFEDGIMLNNKRAYVSEPVREGDEITVNIHEISSSEKIPPVNLPLDILYEDEDLIIINKPLDMPVHPSFNNYTNTLANGLMYYYENKGMKFVYRCMNRLDRNTTGAVLVAKNPLSAYLLSSMIKVRSVNKEYIAVVDGDISLYSNNLSQIESNNNNIFTIDLPIARADNSSIERCINYEKGERAVTHVKVLDILKSENKSVVSCELETGRTHQIRVHMSGIGYPLVGDGLYNEKYKDNIMHRHLLHCAKLNFIHPISKMPVLVQAPFPDDMKKYCIRE